MDSPVSPLVANIYMEAFEVKAIQSAPIPPDFWDRYVDDTHVIIEEGKVTELKDHVNTIDN